MLPIEAIIDREFLPVFKGPPTMERLAELRERLVNALPVDTSVDIAQYMTVISLTVYSAGVRHTRTAKVQP